VVSKSTICVAASVALLRRASCLTILPSIAVAEDLRARRLSGAPLMQPEITRSIVLGLPGNRATGPHVRRAVEVMLATTREVVASGSWLEGRWLGD